MMWVCVRLGQGWLARGSTDDPRLSGVPRRDRGDSRGTRLEGGEVSELLISFVSPGKYCRGSLFQLWNARPSRTLRGSWGAGDGEREERRSGKDLVGRSTRKRRVDRDSPEWFEWPRGGTTGEKSDQSRGSSLGCVRCNKRVQLTSRQRNNFKKIERPK